MQILLHIFALKLLEGTVPCAKAMGYHWSADFRGVQVWLCPGLLPSSWCWTWSVRGLLASPSRESSGPPSSTLFLKPLGWGCPLP